MGKLTSQKRHLQKARDSKHKQDEQPLYVVDKRNFVAASLITGTTFTQQKKAFEL